MVRCSYMPVGFSPCLLLEVKWEKKVDAVIVLAAKDSKKLEGICHGVGYIFPSLAQGFLSVFLAKEQLSVTEVCWV